MKTSAVSTYLVGTLDFDQETADFESVASAVNYLRGQDMKIMIGAAKVADGHTRFPIVVERGERRSVPHGRRNGKPDVRNPEGCLRLVQRGGAQDHALGGQPGTAENVFPGVLHEPAYRESACLRPHATGPQTGRRRRFSGAGRAHGSERAPDRDRQRPCRVRAPVVGIVASVLHRRTRGCGRFSGRPRRPAPAASCGRLSYRTPCALPRRTPSASPPGTSGSTRRARRRTARRRPRASPSRGRTRP